MKRKKNRVSCFAFDVNEKKCDCQNRALEQLSYAGHICMLREVIPSTERAFLRGRKFFIHFLPLSFSFKSSSLNELCDISLFDLFLASKSLYLQPVTYFTLGNCGHPSYWRERRKKRWI